MTTSTPISREAAEKLAQHVVENDNVPHTTHLATSERMVFAATHAPTLASYVLANKPGLTDEVTDVFECIKSNWPLEVMGVYSCRYCNSTKSMDPSRETKHAPDCILKLIDRLTSASPEPVEPAPARVTDKPLTADAKVARIAAIDRMFEEATGWGSWMADASGERYCLVMRLAKYDDIIVPHRYEMVPHD